MAGCTALIAESPRCCSIHPCPVTSLMACLLAEGLGASVQVERCSPDGKGSVTVICHLLR
jgi:hypothetical protein